MKRIEPNLLLAITTAPLVYLLWTSLWRLDLSMPWLSGFAGLSNYTKMGGDPRFWNSLVLTLVDRSSSRWSLDLSSHPSLRS